MGVKSSASYLSATTKSTIFLSAKKLLIDSNGLDWLQQKSSTFLFRIQNSLCNALQCSQDQLEWCGMVAGRLHLLKLHSRLRNLPPSLVLHLLHLLHLFLLLLFFLLHLLLLLFLHHLLLLFLLLLLHQLCYSLQSAGSAVIPMSTSR